jgi:hypothetical protein
MNIVIDFFDRINIQTQGMNIDDIVSHIFALSSHWDLRKAPEVCKKWRNIYYKKKMILGWRAFEAGDVYGIYRTPYYPFEAYYLAALGGHYVIAEYFAPKTHGMPVSLAELYIDSLMFRKCDPEILMLIHEDDREYCLAVAYEFGHMDYINALKIDEIVQIDGIVEYSTFYVNVLLEHFNKEQVISHMDEINDIYCICGITGQKNEAHNMGCEESKLLRGEKSDITVYGAHYTRRMSSILPLSMNKLIYESYKYRPHYLQQLEINADIYRDGYDDSLEFILEKFRDVVPNKMNYEYIPYTLIRMYETLPNYRNTILQTRSLERSMQGIEFMIANDIKIQRDNRYPPLIMSTCT